MSKNLRTLDTDVYFNSEKISIQWNIESIVVKSSIDDKKYNISFDNNCQIIVTEIKKDNSWYMI